MPSLNARIAKAMPLDSQQHVSDIARYRCKKPGTLVSIIPFFFVKRPWPFFLVITALIVWSHLCESRYGSLRPFFNKMSKQFGFATGRTAMFFWFDHLFSLRVKKILLQKTIITAFSHNDQTTLCFWLSRYIQCIYIYEVPSVHQSMSLINKQWMKGSPHHPFWLKGFSMKSTIPYYCGSPMTLEPPHGTPKNAWVIISLPIKCLCYGYNVNPNFQTSPQSASEDVSPPQALGGSTDRPRPELSCSSRAFCFVSWGTKPAPHRVWNQAAKPEWQGYECYNIATSE